MTAAVFIGMDVTMVIRCVGIRGVHGFGLGGVTRIVLGQGKTSSRTVRFFLLRLSIVSPSG